MPDMDIQTVFRANPLFCELDRRALRALAASAEWLEIGGGEYLFRAGDSSETLYLIVSGRVRILRPDGAGESLLLGELGAGQTVGEISIIRAERHSADAIALRDTELLRISRAVFEDLVVRHPAAMLQVTRAIVNRLSAATPVPQRESVRSTRTYAVVPAHSGIHVARFAHALAEELGQAGATLRLDPERVDQALGAGVAQVDLGAGEPHRRLTGWLAQLEDRYRYLIYQGSAEPDGWTRRCVRQADRILLLAHGDQRPFVSRNLAWLAVQGLRASQEIVVLHEPGDAHSAHAWRAAAGVGFHHRVGRNLPARDMARLARMVSGRGTCLVLGGGGARGFAHVGLVRALRERDIPIDAIGGASMGAMIAAMVAMGDDTDQMIARLRETFVTGKFLNDYSFSRISLINAEKFRKRLEAMFGGYRIEDLEIPFYCVSTNLSRGVPMVHDKGSLATWLGASMAVPGIAPPLVHRGDLLVDGGVLNAIPFDPMAKLGRGPIIVSDVSREPIPRVKMDGDDDGDEQAKSLLTAGAAARHLNMFRILFYTATLSGERESREIDRQADLVLRMPVGDVGLLDWNDFDDVIERGYRHAVRRLDEWQAARTTPWQARVVANRMVNSRPVE